MAVHLLHDLEDEVDNMLEKDADGKVFNGSHRLIVELSSVKKGVEILLKHIVSRENREKERERR